MRKDANGDACMFSLARHVDEQLNFFGDVFDKRPSQVSRSSKDPLILTVNENLPLKAKVELLLNSELASQQVWAITNVLRLVGEDVPCDELIEAIPKCLWSKSARVELAAAKTAYALIERDPFKYTAFFIKAITERAGAVPAIEYTECIEKMGPAISQDAVTTSILPLLDQLFSQDHGHHHAACRILESIPPSLLNLSPPVFNRYLRSPILVNFYFVPIVKRFEFLFGPTWIATELPNLLITFGPEFHLGVAIFLVEFVHEIRLISHYSLLTAAFDWAQSDPAIALGILRRVSILDGSRFSDLPSKALAFMPQSASSATEVRKIELIHLLAEVPRLLTANEPVAARTFAAFGADKTVNVRCAFLSKIEILYAIVSGIGSLTTALVQIYQGWFGDSNKEVLEGLVHPFMLGKLAQTRQLASVHLIHGLAEKFVGRWRFFSKILVAIEAFPAESAASTLRNFLGLLERAVMIDGRSLSRYAVAFYHFVIHSHFPAHSHEEFMTYLQETYAKSANYNNRILYLNLAVALVPEFSHGDYFKLVWPPIEGYLDETVVFVRIKLLEYLSFIGHHCAGSRAVGRLVDQAIIGFESDDDPALRALLADPKLIALRRSMSFDLPVPRGAERQTMKLPKPLTPMSFARRDPPIKWPNVRLASPVATARSARPGTAGGTSDMPKVCSDGALSRTARGHS
jgi:hypothetical protein